MHFLGGSDPCTALVSVSGNVDTVNNSDCVTVSGSVSFRLVSVPDWLYWLRCRPLYLPLTVSGFAVAFLRLF